MIISSVTLEFVFRQGHGVSPPLMTRLFGAFLSETQC
jgi:hypothetical protein